MTLEEIKSQTPALLLPYAEAVHQAVIVAELYEGGVDLPEGKGDSVPPEGGDGEEGINPFDDERGKRITYATL